MLNIILETYSHEFFFIVMPNKKKILFTAFQSFPGGKGPTLVFVSDAVTVQFVVLPVELNALLCVFLNTRERYVV